LFHAPPDQLLIFRAEEEFFGVHGVGLDTVNLLVERRQRAASPRLLEPGVAGIADDRQQPSTAVLPVEPAGGFQGAQVGLLHQVLRVVVVLSQPARKIERGTQVP